MPSKNALEASFRDPSGFVFKKNAQVYRQVNQSYRDEYDLLMQSGLYLQLKDEHLLIEHHKTDIKPDEPGYLVIKPRQLPFISYPYEWSFSALKDAALLTLKIQKAALSYEMSLKDASAYNVQFIDSKPIFIDTLSFEKFNAAKPWVAYRQFCQHFLAPLALMAYNDLYLGSFSKNYIDGIPLDLATHLLPAKTKYKLGLGVHLHMHAKSQATHTDPKIHERRQNFGKTKMLGIIDSLESTVRSLHPPKQKTTWGEYYTFTNYQASAFKNKFKIIDQWIAKLKPKSVWDAGANDASFSRLASKKGIFTLASDIDPIAIEVAYRKNKSENDQNLLPLVIDLTNPSPAIGWANQERDSFISRCNFDLSMCLAFIHHLSIANNLPFSYVAELFYKTSKNLIIEFVPKKDSKAAHLLASREDIFAEYNEAAFEKAFSEFFKIIDKKKVQGSLRILYLMKRK